MVSASAPAKVILFGEHAVVYGHPAVAVPVVSLRASAEAEQTAPGSGICIVVGDRELRLAVLSKPGPTDDPLILAAKLVLCALGVSLPDVRITLYSEIPVASGLGSGAAVSAAVARALALAVGRSLDDSDLNALVFEVEKVHHGTPSGVDNTVVVYERPVYFVRGRPVEVLSVARPFTLLVADSGRRALTRDVVGDVRRLYEVDHGRVGPVLEAIGRVTAMARVCIESGEVEALGPLMDQNQGYLVELGVSSPELDVLVEGARRAGALGAKLSGAGRGGHMIALLAPELIEVVAGALHDMGAARVISTLVG